MHDERVGRPSVTPLPSHAWDSVMGERQPRFHSKIASGLCSLFAIPNDVL